MQLESVLTQFSLLTHNVTVDNTFFLTVIDQNENEVYQHNLVTKGLGIEVVKDGDEIFAVLGKYVPMAPVLRVVINPVPDLLPFSMDKHGGGFGVGDLRDVGLDRIAHMYDLHQQAIELSSDGVDLSIYCAGSTTNLDLPWYQRMPYQDWVQGPKPIKS